MLESLRRSTINVGRVWELADVSIAQYIAANYVRVELADAAIWGLSHEIFEKELVRLDLRCAHRSNLLRWLRGYKEYAIFSELSAFND
jgi:hypothetical protein